MDKNTGVNVIIQYICTLYNCRYNNIFLFRETKVDI